MSKRRTPAQRVVEFFMSVPLNDARATLDMARVIVDTRTLTQDAAPIVMSVKPKVTRKPRTKKAPPTSNTITSAVAGEKVQ